MKKTIYISDEIDSYRKFEKEVQKHLKIKQNQNNKKEEFKTWANTCEYLNENGKCELLKYKKKLFCSCKEKRCLKIIEGGCKILTQEDYSYHSRRKYLCVYFNLMEKNSFGNYIEICRYTNERCIPEKCWLLPGRIS